NLIQRLEGFDERLVKRQDYDLFVRALLHGYSPVACPAPVFAYRSHDLPGRISRISSKEAFENQLQMFERQVALLTQTAGRKTAMELERGLGATIWITGRNCLRAGYRDIADKLFHLASTL